MFGIGGKGDEQVAVSEAPLQASEVLIEQPAAAVSVPVSAPPSFEAWIKSVVFDFLDLADLPTSGDRHNALCALKVDFNACFKIVESYFSLQDAYNAATIAAGDSIPEFITEYKNKISILKKQIGIYP